VPSYLLELYQPRARPLSSAADDARRVEAVAALAGRELRYVRTLFVAEDETCFHVFEAPTREAVVDAASRAGLEDARVTEAVQSEST
jgi:hypothetical protein